MKSPTAVAKIADPMKRLTAAAQLVRDADAAIEEARARRDMATLVAHLDQGIAPVTLYRDTLDISRGLFNRIIQRAPAARPEIPDALDVAKTATKQVRKYKAVSEQAREIRDVTMLMLMNGEDEDGNPVKPVSNADIARATDLTTARVAQVRTGTR